MDIKLKNKGRYAAIFIVMIYAFAVFLLFSCDFVKNLNYIGKDAYFKSSTFKQDLESFFYYNVKPFYTDYKDYNLRTNIEKIDEKEIENLREKYENEMNIKINEIENQYNAQIISANNEKDKEKSKRLAQEKEEKIKRVKEKDIKTEEQLKGEVLLKKDNQYAALKKYLEDNAFLEYYIIGNHKQIFTNIHEETTGQIEKHIKENSVYTIKFPQENCGKELQLTNIWFRNNGYEGYFIVPAKQAGYSQLHANITYYQSVGKRVILEGLIAILSLVFSAAALFFLKKEKGFQFHKVERLGETYSRLPIDLRAVVLFFYTLCMFFYVKETHFFYKPYEFLHIVKLSFIAIYVGFLFFNILSFKRIIEDKEMFKMQWQNCFWRNILLLIRESFIIRSIALKILGLVIATILFGWGSIIAVEAHDSPTELITRIYILLYLIFVPFYIFKRVAYFNKIIKGAESIAAGNLNYVIEEKGKSNLAQLAQNINNMKNGFRKSLEEQTKSERLKSELITNVSHDLKTPLTTIVNYVNLLRKERLSEEEKEGYLAVLDRKAQRLKILIEDLFEASKMASGAVDLNMEKVDLVALLRQAMAEIDEKIEQSSLVFKVNALQGNIYTIADGKKTWRVFENLISNILKYAQAHTRVYIDLKEEENKIYVVMKNISAYEMNFDVKEIFERFKRGDVSRNTEGSGLGLAIAKSIMELQNGTLDIETDGDLFKAILQFNKVV